MHIYPHDQFLIISTDISDGSWDEDPKNQEAVFQNRKKLCEKLDIDFSSLVLCHQLHTDTIYEVPEKSQIKNFKIGYPDGVDALISVSQDIFLVIRTADCLPVFFFDETSQAFGVAHCGWKGVYKELASSTLLKLIEKFGCEKKNIRIIVGPGIGACCYKLDQVKDDRLEKCQQKFGAEVVENAHLDLKKALEIELTRIGISADQMSFHPACTCCDERYFSYYRAHQKQTGQMAHMIGRKK